MAREKSEKSRKDTMTLDRMLARPNTKQRTPTDPLGDLGLLSGELRNCIYSYIDDVSAFEVALPDIDHKRPAIPRLRFRFFTDPETRTCRQPSSLLRVSTVIREEYGSYILRPDQTFYLKATLDHNIPGQPLPVVEHVQQLFLRVTVNTMIDGEIVLKQLNRAINSAPNMWRLSMHIRLTPGLMNRDTLAMVLDRVREGTAMNRTALKEYAIVVEGLVACHGIWHKRDSTTVAWPGQPQFETWSEDLTKNTRYAKMTPAAAYYERKRFRNGLPEELADVWAVAEYHPRPISLGKRVEYDFGILRTLVRYNNRRLRVGTV